MPAPERAWRRLWRAFRWGENARKAERQRIAADLHDGPLQSIIALQMRLGAARSLAERDPAAALDELGELARLAGAVAAELRSFLETMRPPVVETTDLAALARPALEDFRKAAGVAVRFVAPDGPLKAPAETCLEFLQILREALANVRRHACASQVTVSLGSARGQAELVVEDNGVGFPFSGTFTLEELERSGTGPQCIRQRVRNLRGELTLTSNPGHGSRLSIGIPL
jgi:signal transduction histidine kinase